MVAKDNSRGNSYKMAPFFPNKPAVTMELLSLMSEAAMFLSEPDSQRFVEVLSHACSDLTPTTFASHQGGVKVITRQLGSNLTFPSPLPRRKFEHLLCGYEEWLHRKYCLPEFVAVDPGDVVIDCGAYVGGFTLSAARVASQVHLFEPDVLNYSCAVDNTARFSNVLCNNLGLYSESKILDFYISSSNVDHSILPPDCGVVKEVRKISVISISDYSRNIGLDRIDFLKLEAEGVEPEIWQGLNGLKPKKIAVDVSPERVGTSPLDFFITHLSRAGYEVRLRGNVLFGRKV